MDSVVLHKRTEISGKTPSPEIIDYGEYDTIEWPYCNC